MLSKSDPHLGLSLEPGIVKLRLSVPGASAETLQVHREASGSDGATQPPTRMSYLSQDAARLSYMCVSGCLGLSVCCSRIWLQRVGVGFS